MTNEIMLAMVLGAMIVSMFWGLYWFYDKITGDDEVVLTLDDNGAPISLECHNPKMRLVVKRPGDDEE